MVKNKLYVMMFVLIVTLPWLSACQPEESSSPPKNVKAEQKSIKSGQLPAQGFIEVIGWITDSEVVAVYSEGEATVFNRYNVYDGTIKKIYESSSTYVSASISPDRDKILIHSSQTSYSAQVSIIDLSGELMFQEEMPSYELTYTWNKFNENDLLMTSFSEDWSYQVYQVNIEEKEINKIEVKEPFVQWQSATTILFQDWDTEEISVAAPLFAQNILDGKTEMIVDESIHFNQFKNTLLSIFPREEGGPFTYQFITAKGEIQSEFTVDLLSRFSDWLVPYYDMIEGKNELITFVADEQGSFDTYAGTFSLRKWDVLSGKDTLVSEDMPLEPIQCSPNGETCLYGNQLEKVITLKKSSIVQLLKDEGADM